MRRTNSHRGGHLRWRAKAGRCPLVVRPSVATLHRPKQARSWRQGTPSRGGDDSPRIHATVSSSKWGEQHVRVAIRHLNEPAGKTLTLKSCLPAHGRSHIMNSLTVAAAIKESPTPSRCRQIPETFRPIIGPRPNPLLPHSHIDCRSRLPSSLASPLPLQWRFPSREWLQFLGRCMSPHGFRAYGPCKEF